MSYINFESSRVKEHAREEKRMAREMLLEKAEANYNKKKQVEERRKERGEDKWILPSVDARLKAEAIEMRREKKKKKKDKKEEKKKKKKKKRERKSSSSSSSSSSEEEQWVEKKDTGRSSGEQKDPDEPSKSATGQAKERDEWMSMPGLFPCVTRDKLREKTRTKSEAELKREKEKYMLDSLGQSDRELNPYWKDGGCGLPQTASSSVSLASKNVGDGGANWLRRALERAKQQAADEGRSLEDVAAERWGSLKKLESLIEEAENRTGHQRPNYREQNQYRRRGEFRKPDENSRSERSYASSQSSGQRNWRKKDTSSQRRSEEPRRRKSPTPPPSSSSSSSDEAEPTKEEAPAAVLTEKELNELGAKLVKAELMGNEKLAAELQTKLDAARAARKNSKQAAPTSSSSKQEEETVILTRTDSRGFVRPLEQHAYPEPSGGRRKKQKVETHADGKRVRYFADDDKYSLQEMFQREKLSTVEDQNEAFAKLAAKGIGRPDSEYDMDDVFAEHARMKESDGKTQARERDRAIREHKRADRALENCNRCFGSKSTMKHLIVAIGTKTYLCLPPHQSLTTGHCLIVPMFHIPCATQLDEDVWAEMQMFRKALTAMFSKMDEDVVFFETAMHLGRFPHMVLECVPMPKETGDLAPIYFKKAILECEMEWSNNKKVVDLSKKDVRRAIPKGLPYFSVDFGLEGGFAHVIEDEKLFPQNFAQEIIGGMLDLDHSLWRKQRRENFDVQCKKVVEFAKLWKPYDFTHKESSGD